VLAIRLSEGIRGIGALYPWSWFARPLWRTQSKEKSSPAWALAAMCLYVLFGLLPVAIVISPVATLRRSGQMWMLVVMWVLIVIPMVLTRVITPVSPWL
jgi:hypothetical protein